MILKPLKHLQHVFNVLHCGNNAFNKESNINALSLNFENLATFFYFRFTGRKKRIKIFKTELKSERAFSDLVHANRMLSHVTPELMPLPIAKHFLLGTTL